MYAITYAHVMTPISSTDLRKNLSTMMDKVNDDHAPLLVTRASGKPAVLISLEDYTAMDETTYLLSSPANREALERSIQDFKDGKVVKKTIDELEVMTEQ